MARLPELDQDAERTALIARDILEQLGDGHSLPFYRRVAARVPEAVIRQTLAEVKADRARHPARLFTYRMNQYAERRANRSATP